MRRAATLALFVVTSPLYVLGIILTPAAWLRSRCYRIVSWSGYKLLAEWQPYSQESGTEAYFRRSRRARKHMKVVR